MEAVLGFFLGVTASAVFWLLTVKILSPRLEVPNYLLFRTDDSSETHVSFVLQNRAFRACFNISVFAILRVKRQNENPKSFRNFQIALNTTGSAKLTPYLPRRERKIYQLKFLQSGEILDSPWLKELVAEAKHDNLAFFKSVCKKFPGSHVEVNAIGYDSITSAVGFAHRRGILDIRSGSIVFEPKYHGRAQAADVSGSASSAEVAE